MDAYSEINVFRTHLERLRPIRLRQQDRELAGRLSGRHLWRFNAVRTVRPLVKPLQFAGVALSLVREHSHRAGNSGRTVWRQCLDQLQLQKAFGLGGKYYYEFGLYDDDARRQAPFFIADPDLDVVLRFLSAGAYPADSCVLNDKYQFYLHCEEYDLPSIPVLGHFVDGSVRWETRADGELPQTDLFSKPSDWWGGQAARKWHRSQSGGYESDRGRIRSPEQVVEVLSRASEVRPFVLQPCIGNHNSLRRLVGDTLVCARILTIRYPGSEPAFGIAYISLPIGETAVANFASTNSNTVAAPVNGDTGILGPAYSKTLAESGRFIEVHPTTGERIDGYQIPDWQEGIQLALRAHTTFEKIAYVGWDVAFTNDGPILIEGNVVPGIESIQIAHQRPLGDTELVWCLNAHLNANM